MATAQASVPLLHRFLGLGLVFAASVFLILRSLGIPALLDDVGMRVVFAYSFSGVAFVVTAVGLLFLKPRVPERPGGQSVEQVPGQRPTSPERPWPSGSPWRPPACLPVSAIS